MRGDNLAGRKALTPVASDRPSPKFGRGWRASASRVRASFQPDESLLRLLALAVMVAVRVVALNADPPSWLSWSTGINTDEGFYTLDARHEVLWGHLAPGNFHDRLLSPLLSLLQQGVFTVFGPDLLAARVMNIVFGLLTIAVFWLGLRRVFNSQIADAGALFLGLAPPFVFYNRLALQETPTVFWLVLAFALWASAKGRPGSLFSGVAFGIAVIVKPLALLALPALVWLWRKPSWAVSVLALGMTLLLYALLWYGPHYAELVRMGTFYRVHQFQPHSWFSVWLNIRRGFIGGERGIFPYLLALMPVPTLLALWAILRPRLTPPSLAGKGYRLTHRVATMFYFYLRWRLWPLWALFDCLAMLKQPRLPCFCLSVASGLGRHGRIARMPGRMQPER
jgi:hypothetical protein